MLFYALGKLETDEVSPARDLSVLLRPETVDTNVRRLILRLSNEESPAGHFFSLFY